MEGDRTSSLLVLDLRARLEGPELFALGVLLVNDGQSLQVDKEVLHHWVLNVALAAAKVAQPLPAAQDVVEETNNNGDSDTV